jgi:hypothetical protein
MNNFALHFMSLFISLLTAEGFMCLIGALTNHYIVGIAVGAGTFGMFMVVQGFFQIHSEMPHFFYELSYLSFHFYQFRAFMVAEFDGIDDFEGPQFYTGKQVLEFYDIKDPDVTVDLGVTFAWGIFYQLCFTAVLYFKHTGRR